jgi:hypothetical protein
MGGSPITSLFILLVPLFLLAPFLLAPLVAFGFAIL